MIETYDVIVIGGGASGILSSIECAKFSKVLLIEANDRIGKKILASGNGRCNLSNINLSSKNYNTSKVSSIINKYNTQEIIKKWNEYGLLTKLEEERVYPYSESANSVLNILLKKISESNITLKLNTKATSVTYNHGMYLIETKDQIFQSRYIIFACGSFATTGLSSYGLLEELGHTTTSLTPSLCALKSNDIIGANGVRCKAECYLEIENKKFPKERGELLFKDGAISGVLAFRMSSYIAREHNIEDKNIKLHIDFVPDYSIEELSDFILKSTNRSGDYLEGLFHKAINQNIYAHTKMDRSLKMSPLKANSLANTAKDYVAKITGLMGFKNAQVISGGIDLKDINMDTLESKICKNLFIIGEMLDIDGECGGYNLHWAWASALACSNQIKGDFND